MRSRALLIALFGLWSASAANAAMQTRIAVNNYFAEAIRVYPGDIVNLSADQFDVYPGGSYQQNRLPEDFVWASDSVQDDYCDREYGCNGTNFRETAYGVSFYVPYNMGNWMRITVQNKFDGTYADLELYNARVGQVVPPREHWPVRPRPPVYRPHPRPRPGYPAPRPRPAPAPRPRPVPVPHPAPRPDPRPAPRPTPHPVPRPNPAPRPPETRPAPRPNPGQPSNPGHGGGGRGNGGGRHPRAQ